MLPVFALSAVVYVMLHLNMTARMYAIKDPANSSASIQNALEYRVDIPSFESDLFLSYACSGSAYNGNLAFEAFGKGSIPETGFVFGRNILFSLSRAGKQGCRTVIKQIQMKHHINNSRQCKNRKHQSGIPL